MHPRLLLLGLLCACDGPVDLDPVSPDLESEIQEDLDDLDSSASPPPPGVIKLGAHNKSGGTIPTFDSVNECTNAHRVTTLTVVDADGAECTDCPWSETEVEVTIENSCQEGDLTIDLTDGCLDWRYKLHDNECFATVARGEADCFDEGLDSVVLGPGESWTEVVPVEVDPVMTSGNDLELRATTPMEARYVANFALIPD